MFGIKGRLSLGLFSLFILSIPVRSDLQNLNLCEEGNVTSDSVDLIMDTSLIAETQGFCSCVILFHGSTVLNLYLQNVVSPGCGTVIELNDTSLNSTCQYNKAQKYYNINSNNGNEILIHVRSVGNSQGAMSGILQMRAHNNTYKTFSLKCYAANVSPKTSHTETISTTTKISTTASKETTSLTTEGGKTSKSNQVALIAGCTSGALALVGLIVVVVVLLYRRKKAKRKHEDTTLKTDRSRSTNNDCIVENELYMDDIGLPMSLEMNPNKSAASQIEGETKTPNRDLYATVDKSRKYTVPPESRSNHSIAPSGDLYAVVEKAK